jgi:hypothetical protein
MKKQTSVKRFNEHKVEFIKIKIEKEIILNNEKVK